MNILFELIYNLGILISISIISSYIGDFGEKNSKKLILHGVLFGVGSIVGMIHPLVISTGLIFDGRSVILSLSALFFGPYVALISGSIALIFRVYLGGSGMIMGVLVIITSSVIGSLTHRFTVARKADVTIINLFVMGMSVHILMILLMFTLPLNQIIPTLKVMCLPILISYPLATVLIGRIFIEANEQKRIKAAKDKAEMESNYKSEFVAIMSHELRTPLNAIIGFNNILIKTELSDKQRVYLEKSMFSSQRLLDIINNILDYSKIEANKIELEYIPFELLELLNSIESMFATSAEEKGLSFKIKTDSMIPKILIGDPTRLFQIITNLINNGIKFTQFGGVEVVAKLDFLDTKKVRIIFMVKDTGIGMTKEHLNKIFVPFSQADSSTTRAYGGTGLGLSICKQLTELMGGTIEAQSIFGEGSTFNVLLDFDYLDSMDINSKENQYAIDSIRFEGKRVLLAEDNEINQLLFNEVLLELGMELDIVKNGLEAVEKIKNSSASYDLILMDIQMPIMNGYEAAKRIREMGVQIPILAITADAILGINQKLFESEINGYILKPLNLQHLILAIQKALNI